MFYFTNVGRESEAHHRVVCLDLVFSQKLFIDFVNSKHETPRRHNIMVRKTHPTWNLEIFQLLAHEPVVFSTT